MIFIDFTEIADSTDVTEILLEGNLALCSVILLFGSFRGANKRARDCS